MTRAVDLRGVPQDFSTKIFFDVATMDPEGSYDWELTTDEVLQYAVSQAVPEEYISGLAQAKALLAAMSPVKAATVQKKADDFFAKALVLQENRVSIYRDNEKQEFYAHNIFYVINRENPDLSAIELKSRGRQKYMARNCFFDAVAHQRRVERAEIAGKVMLGTGAIAAAAAVMGTIATGGLAFAGYLVAGMMVGGTGINFLVTIAE